MPKTKKVQNVPFNYDPNIRWADQTVKVTLGTWQYRTTREVVIGGNSKGANIFDHIEESVLALLMKENDIPEDEYFDNVEDLVDAGYSLSFEMLYETEDKLWRLHCEPDQEDLEQWIREHIIGLEIIDIQPEKK